MTGWGMKLSGFSCQPNYYSKTIFPKFLWDETIVLDARLGNYLLIARRKENDWYIAAMTDWTPRDLEADLSFPGKVYFRAFTCEDGINAEKHSGDYRMGYELVNSSKKLKIKMAPGGGYAQN